MINQLESKQIASALTDFAVAYPDRVRIRFSGESACGKWDAVTEDSPIEAVTCPAQTGKVKNCAECALCWSTPKPIRFEGHSHSLKNDHFAVVEGDTKYRRAAGYNVDPATEKCVLKPSSNAKIGTFVKRGAWKGSKFLTLTLTERKTCPRSCKHWNDCYGNNMHMAKRISTVGLMEKIESDLEALNPNKMFAIRLHVLGDFYSVEYVEFWNRMFAKFDNIKVFGYTAHEIDNSHLIENQNRKVA